LNQEQKAGKVITIPNFQENEEFAF